MTSEAINEVKNEEVDEIDNNKVIEETNEETQNEENEEATKQEEVKTEIKEEAKPKPKATPKKLPRSVKAVELVECGACNKKMLPKSLRNTHPYYCKGQPTETLPVNRQKASYGTKVEQKLRKEIEDEMRQKYEIKTKEVEPTIKQSDLNEVKTKPKPVKIIESETPPKQITASELLQQSYNELKRLRQQEKQEKINKFKLSMF